MTRCLGYWLWQQGEAGPGLPERSYWHKDEVEMATNVATENTEHDCVIRKPGFPTGLVGGDQHSHRELLAQPLGRTASRLWDILRQTNYVL